MEDCICGESATYLCKPCNVVVCHEHKPIHEKTQKEHIFEEFPKNFATKIVENRHSKMKISNKCKYIASMSVADVKHFLAEEYGLLIERHTDYVNSMAITSDSKYLVTGSNDHTVIIWNLQERAPLSVLKGHTGRVNSIAITSDSKYIVSGSEDKTARI